MDVHPLIYPEFCAWYGALEFARQTGDKVLEERLIQRFQPLWDKEAALVPTARHVDYAVFGIVPLEIYLITHDEKYRKMGITFADRQWDSPTNDGLSPDSRFWIDDMYMITILQVVAFRATQDHKYIDRAATEMVAYLNRLQQPDGLFFHAPDVPFYWSRGSGWVSAGMTELLISLPSDHPLRPSILAAYRRMMDALVRVQGKDGMWHELLDDDAAWPESSGSAMFAFALAEGIQHGWLARATFGPSAKAAWIAVSGYVDQNADLTSVCEGTDKKSDREYYLLRKRRTGDFHGQAAVLWAATAYASKAYSSP